MKAADLEYAETIYLGDDYWWVDPWDDVCDDIDGGSISNGTFLSSSCTTTYSTALMITEYTHNYPETNYFHITGLITGTYTATAVVKRKKNNITNTYTILYHVTVINRPVVTSITIPNTLELSTGNTYTFSPVIAESGASTTLTWTSTKPSVVTVTSAGKITAKSPGQSTIMCSAANGVTAQCLVTVTPLLANSVQLNISELELNVGDSYILTATVLPEAATNKTLEWSSTNENVALVEGDGTIRGTGTGYCTIKARSTDGSNKMASCSIHVVSGPSSSLSGDVNGDGNISIADVTALIDFLLNGGNTNNNGGNEGVIDDIIW